MRTIEPTAFTAGEALEWTKCLPDYPATLWTLKYYFRGRGPGFNVTATADGDDYAISVPATDTEDMTPNERYSWQAWVIEIADTTNKKVINEGRVSVKEGFNTDDPGEVDTRSLAKRAYDAIDAALLGKASSTHLEYEISTPAGSKRVKQCTQSELLSSLKFYANRVRHERLRERIRKGGKLMTTVNVRTKDA